MKTVIIEKYSQGSYLIRGFLFQRKLWSSHIFVSLIMVFGFYLIFPPDNLRNTQVLGAQIVEIEDSTSLPDQHIVTHGPKDQKKIALTFDAEMTDGMKANLLSGKVKSSYDKRIVDTLNQTNIKATFFLTGMWIELYPDVTRELSNNPLFELGSHSYTDSSFEGSCYGLEQLSETKEQEDIESTQKLLKEVAGVDNHLFRFPGGCYSQEDLDTLNNSGLKVVHWDVSGSDGFNLNSASIEQNVINRVQNGSVIILHLNGAPTAPATAEALPKIISELKTRGFEFVKVSELL